MLNKIMIITLTTILNHQTGYFYSKDGEYLNYVHGDFNFYQSDIKDISKDTLEAILEGLEKERIWERKYPKSPLVGKVIDISALKRKIKSLNPESIIEETIYNGFKIIGKFRITDKGKYFFTHRFIDDKNKEFNCNSKRQCKETIDHYLKNKANIDSSKIHVMEYIGGYGGGFKFISKEKLNEELYNTSLKYAGSFDSFINSVKDKVEKQKIVDYIWME